MIVLLLALILIAILAPELATLGIVGIAIAGAIFFAAVLAIGALEGFANIFYVKEED